MLTIENIVSLYVGALYTEADYEWDSYTLTEEANNAYPEGEHLTTYLAWFAAHTPSHIKLWQDLDFGTRAKGINVIKFMRANDSQREYGQVYGYHDAEWGDEEPF